MKTVYTPYYLKYFLDNINEIFEDFAIINEHVPLNTRSPISPLVFSAEGVNIDIVDDHLLITINNDFNDPLSSEFPLYTKSTKYLTPSVRGKILLHYSKFLRGFNVNHLNVIDSKKRYITDKFKLLDIEGVRIGFFGIMFKRKVSYDVTIFPDLILNIMITRSHSGLYHVDFKVRYNTSLLDKGNPYYVFHSKIYPDQNTLKDNILKDTLKLFKM